MNPTELDLLLNGALRVARVTQTRARALQQVEFASSTPRLLAQLIERAAGHVQARLLRLRHSGYDTEPLYNEAQIWFSYLQMMYSHLRFVDGAAVRRTPWSLVTPFEELAGKLHAGARFLVRPQWEYNYSIREMVGAYRTVLKDFATREQMEAIFRDIPERIYVTSFAGVDRLNVILHVVLGHEIAHPIANDYLSKEDEKCVVASAYKELQKTEPQVDLFTWERIRKIIDVRRGALAELMCDHVCLTLFGSAAVFALEESGRMLGLDKFSLMDHHPPWRYRIRCALELLPKEGFMDYCGKCSLPDEIQTSLLARYERIEELTAIHADIEALFRDTEIKIAYQLVEKALPDVQDYIREHTRNEGFTLDSLPTEGISDLVRRLAEGILPNEYWRGVTGRNELRDAPWESHQPVAADLQTILICAAIHRTHYLPSAFQKGDDDEMVDAYLDDCHRSDRLVLRAIECAHLQKVYRNAKGGKWES